LAHCEYDENGELISSPYVYSTQWREIPDDVRGALEGDGMTEKRWKKVKLPRRWDRLNEAVEEIQSDESECDENGVPLFGA
jgi:hypothetical protein